MSKRSAERPSNPVGWEGVGFGLDAATLGGRTYAAVLEAFPDATPFELECALTLSPYLGSFLRAEEAVARVGALRQARRGRPDLSEADWQQCVRLLYPTLGEQQRQEPQQLLTAIAALRPQRGVDTVAYAPPVRRGPGRPGWTEALFLKRWHEAKSKAAPSDRLADIAAVFRARDGKVGGIGIHSLRRLLRRFTT